MKPFLPPYISYPGSNRGRYLKQYNLEEEIERTSFSHVYRATHGTKTVALKIPSNEDSFVHESINREAEALRIIPRHNGVVKLEHFVHSPVPYLALEYLDGNVLSDFQNAHSQEYRERFVFDLMYLCAQAALAVDHVNKYGVIHRDIKPANIMVSFPRGVKLIDFGVAQLPNGHPLMQDLELQEYVCGTPLYMPPEQFSTNPTLKPSSDVFSLGQTLMALLLGHANKGNARSWAKEGDLHYDINATPAIQGSTPYLLANLEAKCTPSEHNGAILAEWDSILMKAIQPDPNARYQSAAEFANELFGILKQATATKMWRPDFEKPLPTVSNYDLPQTIATRTYQIEQKNGTRELELCGTAAVTI